MSFIQAEKKAVKFHHEKGYKMLVVGQALAGGTTSVPKPTYMSCLNLFNPNSMLNLLEHQKVVTSIKILGDFPINANRNRFVRESVEAGADYLFFMDMDMTFPADTLERLFEIISDERPIVSGMYFLKYPAYTPVMGRYIDWTEELIPYKETYDKLGFVHPDGRQLAMWRAFTYFDKTFPFRADVIGLGCVLMKADIFRKMQEPEKGWFYYTDDPREGKRQFTMDEVMPLCAQLAKNNIPIWIDPRVQCGHITAVESNVNLFEAHRDTTFATDAKENPEKFNEMSKLFIDVREEQRNGSGIAEVVSSSANG